MPRFRCIPSEPLGGDLDLEEQAAQTPGTYVVKGMFLNQLVKQLGPAGWEEVRPKLRWPPAKGRYVMFKDYPQHDHLLLSGALARRRYPRLSLREALRRLARDDVRTFGESTFGGVMLSLARDWRSALHKVPAVFERVAPGDWRITATDLDPETVRIEFTDYYGDWSYTVGQLEGIVIHYGGSPQTVVDELAPQHVLFDVESR